MTGQQSMTDQLWQPDQLNRMASSEQNERVRAMLAEELRGWASRHEKTLGEARGQFARDWVALALQVGMRSPAQELRQPLREGETMEERRIDAGRTRLRQFMAGHDELSWALAGIEAVICDRRGMALPGGAYNTQQRLQV